MARLIVAMLAVAACGGRPPCGTCPEGNVCDLDGTCRALAPREGLRFTRAVRLRARDWAGTRTDRRSEVGHAFDELLLGGEAGGRIYVSFDLPEGEVVGAVLTLMPAQRAPALGDKTLRAFRTAPFEGRHVSRRIPPRRIGRYGTARALRGVEDRPLHIDVTDLVRESGSPRVHLAVEAPGSEGAPWRIASPSAEDAMRHPRLDLRLR